MTFLTYKGRYKAPHRPHLVLLEVKIDETIALGKPSISRENATAGHFLDEHNYSDETHRRQRTPGDIIKSVDACACKCFDTTTVLSRHSSTMDC
jgi:hypothetical protein